MSNHLIKGCFPLIILSTGLVMIYKLSRHKSEKKKQIILGITLIVVVAPFLSWLVGGLYAIFGSVEATGWTEIIYPMIIFL